ncbi:FUSC family protein [Pararobbsia silviterrae]|uniref:FUSC family protein n=1 Tax=Pararobbsia silviterrae TaxID=1792498 RepID=A0A494X1P1_9BURK|nr:FUSC family protein [Pararobbsia silviterrae]RKP44240.1 FUSC family protein [Pararobbsia silviterrae]
MRLSPVTRLRLGARALLRQVTDPYRRYRNAGVIHAIRVATSILASIALTTGIDLPHGEWASITVLVVIGGLQHLGNIRKKAAERALGTLIGASGGLLLILVQSTFHVPGLTYLLMAVGCGVGGYYAIGKAGYVALLGAITLVIVAGHGDAAISDGLWRTADVLIGIVIALVFSFALPLYATYSWRYKLADGLRDCARLYSRIVGGHAVGDDEHRQILARQGTMLVQLRGLMPSVAKEIDVPGVELESIQSTLRSIVGALEMLTALHLATDDAGTRTRIVDALRGEDRKIREALIGIARALKYGTVARLRAPKASRPIDVSAFDAPIELERYIWLHAELRDQIDALRAKLAELATHWNI